MSRIVSISRRTDIPAFYGPWFMNRVAEGFAGWTNPFGGQRYVVSLRREDVACLAFWSKNYRPFLPALRELKARGYPCFFNCTITGLPAEFECGLASAEDAIDSLARYSKVVRNVAAFERAHGVRVADPPPAERLRLAGLLAGLAGAHGMTLHSCCCDGLVGGAVLKAHCLDAGILARLYQNVSVARARRPTRRECGCADSVDIGAYDSCPHGCIYCYANVDRARAATCHAAHDPAATFLGRSRAESDVYVAEIRDRRPATPGALELGLAP